MEISPIAGIRVVPVAKERPVDPELSVPFVIERPARASDDTYSSDNRKASGAEENDENSEEIDERTDDSAPEPDAARVKTQPTQINFFA